MQRRAQLVGVDAERFAETQAFVVGGSAGPEDQVVDHLADLAGAGRAEMKDVGGKGAERGTAGVEAAGSPAPKISSLPAVAAASPRASGMSSSTTPRSATRPAR